MGNIKKSVTTVLSVVLVIALLVLMGCGADSGKTVSKTNQEPTSNSNTAPVAVQTPPKIPLEKEVANILEGSKKIKSLHYFYFDSDIKRQGDEYFSKGTKMRVTVFTPQSYEITSLTTDVFIDTVTNTIKAYCLDKKKCDEAAGQERVPDRKYIRRTPLDWANLITNGKQIASQSIDNYQTLKISSVIDDQETILYIDDYFGVPRKVEQAGKTITFEQIEINTVEDSEVALP